MILNMAILLVSSSLTISPISTSYHYLPTDPTVAQNMPRTIGGQPGHINATDSFHPMTWHPGFYLKYETKYTQTAAFYFQDSFDKPAGGFVFGPKYSFFKDIITVGGVVGGYVRERRYDYRYRLHGEPNYRYINSKPPVEGVELAEGVEMLPIAGATLGIKVPLNDRFFLSVDTTLTYKVIHTTYGIGYNFK